jgi:hypothetical protein
MVSLPWTWDVEQPLRRSPSHYPPARAALIHGAEGTVGKIVDGHLVDVGTCLESLVVLTGCYIEAAPCSC